MNAKKVLSDTNNFEYHSRYDPINTHPHEGLHSPIPFGFRPISLGVAINLG